MLSRYALQWRRISSPLILAVLSVTAAVALWVAVTEAENPNQVRVFSGSIEVKAVNIPDGQAVAGIKDPVVNLTISAPESVFKHLTPSDFRAEVDLSGVTQKDTQQRVVGRVVGNKDIEIVSVLPAVVTVTLEPLTSKTVPVQTNKIGTVPQGFSVSSLDASPGQVRVTGADSLVQKVTSASADVNLTGLRVSLRQQYSLVPKDSQGGEVRGVKLDPDTTEVRVSLSQQEVTLAITVVPSVQGAVADGYNLVALSVDPPALAVSGPLELLQGLASISTEPVDVSGLKGDTTKTVKLRLPAGAQSARDNVRVNLRVAPAQGEISLSLVPQMTNVPEGLKPSLLVPAVAVRISGPQPTLNSLSPANVKVSVSLQGLSEGVQVLRPTVSVPESVQVQSIDPAQITVSLDR